MDKTGLLIKASDSLKSSELRPVSTSSPGNRAPLDESMINTVLDGNPRLCAKLIAICSIAVLIEESENGTSRSATLSDAGEGLCLDIAMAERKTSGRWRQVSHNARGKHQDF
jgi:hypothetical protein